MEKYSFNNATEKQYNLAIKIQKRIIEDIEKMNVEDIAALNNVVNSNFNSKELVNYFYKKDDYKYFINQNNIKTKSVLVSAMMNINKENKQ